ARRPVQLREGAADRAREGQFARAWVAAQLEEGREVLRRLGVDTQGQPAAPGFAAIAGNDRCRGTGAACDQQKQGAACGKERSTARIQSFTRRRLSVSCSVSLS